eukprot:scpid62730/ scgid23427/ 
MLSIRVSTAIVLFGCTVCFLHEGDSANIEKSVNEDKSLAKFLAEAAQEEVNDYNYDPGTLDYDDPTSDPLAGGGDIPHPGQDVDPFAPTATTENPSHLEPTTSSDVHDHPHPDILFPPDDPVGDDDTYPDPFPHEPHTGEPDCLRELFIQAGIRPAHISHYIQAFRNNKLDADELYNMDFLHLVHLLETPNYGMTDAQDLYSLHECTTGYGACVQDPHCKNGGRCEHVDIIHRHVCKCPETFQGEQCEDPVKDRLAELEENVLLAIDQRPKPTTSYTRWGKETCNETAGATLAFAGSIGGALSTHTGSGSNYHCLPEDPAYLEFEPGIQNYGLIYSAELTVTAYAPIFAGLANANPRCAVCQTNGRTSTITVSGRNVCPDEWTLEYHGYLMSSAKYEYRTELVCVDQSPDVVPGTSAATPSSKMYPVEAVCGGIRCGPFDKTQELTCAVCSR